VRFAGRIKENVGDKKSGQNKEQVYPQPSEKEVINKPEIMIDDYQQNGKPTEAVQCRVILPVCGCCVHLEDRG